MSNKRVLAVIPACEGAAALPNKNMRIVHGKPMVYYAVRNAQKSRFITDIIVTSPSENMKFDRKFLYLLSKGRKMHLPESDLIMTWSEFISKGYNYQGEYIVKKDKFDRTGAPF